MNTVDQPTAQPTNKLTAATVAVAAMQVLGLVIQNVAPTWYSAEVWAALMPIVTFLVGYYLVKDAPNVRLVKP